MITVDGTDQQAARGTTLAVTIEGPDSWKVVRKKDGRILLTATWQLSSDGNILKDNYTEFQPNGSAFTVNYVYQRTAAGAGFAGSWESTIAMPNSPMMLKIRAYEGDGLSFIQASGEVTQNLKFDGNDYPLVGRGPAQSSTSSAQRVDERTLEIIDKTRGKITRTERVELSPDLKTLTRTMHPVGQREPNIFVFERQ